MDYSLFTPAHRLPSHSKLLGLGSKGMENTSEHATAQDGAKTDHRRFLRPPWPKGVSGNPSGRASDGGGSKDAPLRKLLRAKARKRSELRRLVDGWWDAACEGDAQAREQILRRLDPVLDDPAQGRTVLEGLRLELREGKASVTLVRGQGVAALPGPSDADSETSESRAGGLTMEASESQTPTPETPT